MGRSEHEHAENEDTLERWVLQQIRDAKEKRLHGDLVFEFKGGRCVYRWLKAGAIPPKESSK